MALLDVQLATHAIVFLELPATYATYPDFVDEFELVLSQPENSWMMDGVFEVVVCSMLLQYIGHTCNYINFMNGICSLHNNIYHLNPCIVNSIDIDSSSSYTN